MILRYMKKYYYLETTEGIQNQEKLFHGDLIRLDNIQAAFLNYFFSKYEEVVSQRIASLYDDGLREIDEIHLPEPPNNGDHFDVFQNYEIQAKDRKNLIDFLSQKGIGTLIQWGESNSPI